MFSATTPEDLKSMYDLLDAQDATLLHMQARDMLNKGFQWTLEYGEPRSPPFLRYQWGTPCCDIKLTDSGKYIMCTSPHHKPDFPRPQGHSKYRDPHLPWPEPGNVADVL